MPQIVMPERDHVRSAMEQLLSLGGSRAASMHHDGLHHLEEGTGRPLVLIHGGSGGGANWFRMLGPLSARFRVLAPDLPGFGLSLPRHPGAPLGAAAAALLQDWLRAHDVAGALVAGTSFGGLAALRLAQAAPHRVAALMLLDSAGLGRDLHPLVRIATLPGLTRVGVHPTRRGTRAMFRCLLTSDRSELPQPVERALVDYLFASAAAAGTDYLAATLRLFAGAAGQREIVTPAELRALPQPVSLVWGALDRFLPAAHAHRAASHCRNARMTLVPDAGHSPNWERPGAVIAAIHELADRIE